jgi:CHASE3 domain sensor protein
MKFTKTFSAAIIIAATAGAVSVCSAQSSASAATTTTSATQSTAPYTEGAVWDITMVKTKPGMSDDYLKALAKIFKATNDEQKRQGIITDYKILTGSAATQQDYDILLMVEYPNMAALDSLRDKTDPIDAKLVGSEDQQRQLAVKRLEIREIMGDKLMREITLK